MVRVSLLWFVGCGFLVGAPSGRAQELDGLEARCRALEALAATDAPDLEDLVRRCEALEGCAARSPAAGNTEEILWRTRRVRLEAWLRRGDAERAAELARAALRRARQERVRTRLRDRLEEFRVPGLVALLASGRRTEARRLYASWLAAGSTEEALRGALEGVEVARTHGFPDAAVELISWLQQERLAGRSGAPAERLRALAWAVHLERGHALNVLADACLDPPPRPALGTEAARSWLEAQIRVGSTAEATCRLRTGLLALDPGERAEHLAWLALLDRDGSAALAWLGQTSHEAAWSARVLAASTLPGFDPRAAWGVPPAGEPATRTAELGYLLACAVARAGADPSRALDELGHVLDARPPHAMGRLALERACELLLDPALLGPAWPERLRAAFLRFGGGAGALPPSAFPSAPNGLAYCVTLRSVLLVRFSERDAAVFDLGWRTVVEERVEAWIASRGADRERARRAVEERLLPARVLTGGGPWTLHPDGFLWRVPFQELVLFDAAPRDRAAELAPRWSLGRATAWDRSGPERDLEFVGFGKRALPAEGTRDAAPAVEAEREAVPSAELRAIAACFRPERQRVVHGPDARFEVLSAGDVASDLVRRRPSCRVLHLQVSGRLDGPEGPWLRLHGVPGAGAHELAGESLARAFRDALPRADLVVLSIQAPGANRERAQRASAWIAQMALDAGARAVLVGLRGDEAPESSLAFGWFYEALSRGRATFDAWSDALARLRDEERAAPATFLLFGDVDLRLHGIDPPDLSRLRERPPVAWGTRVFWIVLALLSAGAGFSWGRRRGRLRMRRRASLGGARGGAHG